MDAVVFFLPVALVVAQYFTSAHRQRRALAREKVELDSCCA